MENSFFVFTDTATKYEIKRFHICTWEFNNNSSLVEFGFEICKDSVKSSDFSLSIFIPWFTEKCTVVDLYDKLCVSENSRFIFNESISNTNSLDGGRNKLGVIHKFGDGRELCLLPITFERKNDKILTIKINTQAYNDSENKPNIYFRFSIKPLTPYISIRKKGISKSTIIYDVKVNEKRNIPDDLLSYFANKTFCTISKCFSFNIIPNKYDIVFLDTSSLKSVRTLEFDSFNKYLGDSRVKKDELLVVFNKKDKAESFSFFSIYSQEHIGPGQYALAILVNILCGVLLFIPAYRKSFKPELELTNVWQYLPLEIYLAIVVAFVTLLFFIRPFKK